MKWTIAWMALCAASACKDRPKEFPAEAIEVPATRGPTLIKVFLDGEEVGGATREELLARPVLSSFLPESARDATAWRYVEALGTKAHLTIPRPASNYADHRLVLYVANDGKPGIGLEKPQSDSFAVFQVGIDRVTVRVSTENILGKKPPPRAADLLVEGIGPERTLRAHDFAKIPTATPPGDARGHAMGWRLSDVLATVGSLDRITRVELIDPQGKAIELTHAELTSKEYFPYLKRNRRGRLRFRLYMLVGPSNTVTKQHANVILIRGHAPPP